MKKPKETEAFEVYMPVHLRALRYELRAMLTQKKEAPKGVLKKITKIFEK